MLVNYSSSSSSGSDTEVEKDDETPECKKIKVVSKSRPLFLLPHATGILGSKNPYNVKAKHTDDPCQHGNRVRSFLHERGNWATYVYIPVPCSILGDIQELCQNVLADVLDLQLPTEDLHISLSKTVILQYHLINPFVKSLENAFETSESFNADLDQLKIYCNEERTRTFIGLAVADLYVDKFKKILCKVDSVMSDYNLSTFYEDPSFHVSFLWCLGDKVDLLYSHLDKFNKLVKKVKEYETLSLNVNEIQLKTGNKQFSFKLT